MDDVYNYIEETGIIMTNAGIILNEVQQEYLNTFGADLNISPNTPQGMLISIETNSRIAVADNNANLANQINPNVAGGVYLDALLQLTGSQRIPATYSTVLCTITGVENTIIPAGSEISNIDQSIIFQLIEEVTIPESGIVNNISFQSNVFGPIQAEENTLTTILSSILGWETVTNTNNAIPGSETQSDVQARQLRLNTLGALGKSISYNVIAALNLIPNVSQSGVTFRENVQSTTQVIDETIMVPHSIYVCVGGSNNYPSIASALQNNKSAGCSYNNGLGVNIQQIYTDPNSNQNITVLFDIPSIVSISIKVTVHAFTTVQNVTTAVQNAILTYANGGIDGQPGFVVGAAVSPFQIAAAINLLVPGLFVQNIQIGIISFTQQGLITNGSNSVTSLTYNSPTGGFIGIQVADLISDEGNNIPSGTIVSTIVGSNQITMSNAANFSSISLQGTITNGSNIVTGLTNTSQLQVGMSITGTGIPTLSTILNIIDLNNITISSNATISGTETLNFTPASGATLLDILKFSLNPTYVTTEIPIGIWQQAFTTSGYITVNQV